MFKDSQMDAMLNDIVEIFPLNEKLEAERQKNLELQEQTNSSSIEETSKLQKIELVRLSGLTARANRISGRAIDIHTINNILQKMKLNKIIDWKYQYQCPYCHEVFYQIDDTPANKLKVCDSCQNLFIPGQNLYDSELIIL